MHTPEPGRITLDPGTLPTAAATLTAALSGTVSLWWAVPTAVAAFLAGRRTERVGPIVLALAGVLAAGVVALYVAPGLLPLPARLVAVVVVAGMLPWFAGRLWRLYQQLVRAGWERAEQLQREQRLIAEQARLRERARIAQDMHDVLGHDLSLIALSAGALKLSPGLAEPHRQAASDIRARAATAVERLGEVIGVLREETDGAPTEPGGTDLAALTSAAAAAGLAVDLRVDGPADALPPVVERAAHRVVQESLTNVARHAPGATATVRVTHTPTETEVAVHNDPPPSAPTRGGSSGGHGLIGLTERVRLAGGVFRYGPRPDGGFEVTARLPHTPSVPAPHAPPAPAGPPPEHRRARRRIGRTLAAAVLVPLLTGALLSAGLMVWGTVTASRSVLDPGAFAKLRVGQDRAEVARHLPERQTALRPPNAEPTGDGTTCEFYAITADRFDDRSGDVYRLCFREDRLVSLGTFQG